MGGYIKSTNSSFLLYNIREESKEPSYRNIKLPKARAANISSDKPLLGWDVSLELFFLPLCYPKIKSEMSPFGKMKYFF